MLMGSRKQFEKLLFAAKMAYIAQEQDQVVVKMISEDSEENDNHWRQVSLKTKRDLSSVVTAPGVKESLGADITEFCKAEKWYTSRGVPWRRGFLLHGRPQ